MVLVEVVVVAVVVLSSLVSVVVEESPKRPIAEWAWRSGGGG